MRFEPGIIHSLDGRVFGKKPGDARRVLLMELHAWYQCFYPSKYQPAIEWRGSLSESVAEILQALDDLRFLCYDGASDNIAVPIQIFIGVSIHTALVFERKAA